MKYVVQLVDCNGSIVRHLPFDNEVDAMKKALYWKKFFSKNIVCINNVII